MISATRIRFPYTVTEASNESDPTESVSETLLNVEQTVLLYSNNDTLKDVEKSCVVRNPSGGEGRRPQAGAVARKPHAHSGMRAREIGAHQVRPQVRKLPDNRVR